MMTEAKDEAVGGVVGGTISGKHWTCADCDVNEDGKWDGDYAGLILYQHRQRNHVI